MAHGDVQDGSKCEKNVPMWGKLLPYDSSVTYKGICENISTIVMIIYI